MTGGSAEYLLAHLQTELTRVAGEEPDSNRGNGGAAFDGGVTTRGLADSFVEKPIRRQRGHRSLVGVVDGVTDAIRRCRGMIENGGGMEADLTLSRLNGITVGAIDAEEIRVETGAESALDHRPSLAVDVEIPHVAAATATLNELEGAQLLKQFGADVENDAHRGRGDEVALAEFDLHFGAAAEGTIALRVAIPFLEDAKECHVVAGEEEDR